VRAPPAVVLAILATACGGGPGSVEGSVAGRSLQVADAIFFARTSPNQAMVVLSSRAKACETSSHGANPAGATLLRFTLEAWTQGVPSWLDVGDYKVDDRADKRAINVQFLAFDASCQGLPAQPSGGTVTLDEVDAQTKMAGSFELKFDSQSLRGEFEATHCANDLPSQFAACE